MDQEFQTLFTLPPLNIGFNEPSGGSSVAADSSQQQFSENLPMWHQNQLKIGSFDPGASSSTEVISNMDLSTFNKPNSFDIITLVIRFMKAHRYESRSKAAVKKKRRGETQKPSFDNVRRETRSFAPKLDLFAAGSLRRISRRNPLLFDLSAGCLLLSRAWV
ncbi:hypothetical protein ISN44_As10g006710 [Arabidopsis suecica]|uniref:Uncharacterized protein n=1 Tax=Arabidopsis suecica TaxID=45249 RepID=A0A8T1ZUF2_ARASU|nr:hypothetical protein ISN44_As10g006710 [Arabidopsis suecica]KAG7563915.1 hypothetical protein ISN44_As10g006710 [Arabidopsis suecica]